MARKPYVKFHIFENQQIAVIKTQ